MNDNIDLKLKELNDMVNEVNEDSFFIYEILDKLYKLTNEIKKERKINNEVYLWFHRTTILITSSFLMNVDVSEKIQKEVINILVKNGKDCNEQTFDAIERLLN